MKVKDLTESLKRFDPDAVLNNEVEVGGHSPVTRCDLTIYDGSKDVIEWLRDELKEAESDTNKAEDDLEELKTEILKIIQLCSDGDEAKAISEIEELL